MANNGLAKGPFGVEMLSFKFATVKTHAERQITKKDTKSSINCARSATTPFPKRTWQPNPIVFLPAGEQYGSICSGLNRMIENAHRFAIRSIGQNKKKRAHIYTCFMFGNINFFKNTTSTIAHKALCEVFEVTQKRSTNLRLKFFDPMANSMIPCAPGQ